jgi:hypothetical protein
MYGRTDPTQRAKRSDWKSFDVRHSIFSVKHVEPDGRHVYETFTIDGNPDVWQEQLDIHDQFAFSSNFGYFTAQKEPRRQQYYWYAYRKDQRNRTKKVYLGKSEALTFEHLCAAADRLTRLCVG